MGRIDLFEVIYTTRSMRRLKQKPIPRAVLERIIDAGVHAPSGSNFQNWSFMVVENDRGKKFVRDLYLKSYRKLEDAGTIPRMSEVPLTRRKMFQSAIHLAENMHLAPILLFAISGTDFPTYADHGNPRSITATLHASIYPAVQNMLLAARALGVGATLTTLHYFFEAELKEHFGIPEDKEIAALIPMGYPEGEFGQTSRRPGTEVTFWDNWGRKKS